LTALEGSLVFGKVGFMDAALGRKVDVRPSNGPRVLIGTHDDEQPASHLALHVARTSPASNEREHGVDLREELFRRIPRSASFGLRDLLFDRKIDALLFFLALDQCDWVSELTGRRIIRSIMVDHSLLLSARFFRCQLVNF
jgi:hypothetical protein